MWQIHTSYIRPHYPLHGNRRRDRFAPVLPARHPVVSGRPKSARCQLPEFPETDEPVSFAELFILFGLQQLFDFFRSASLDDVLGLELARCAPTDLHGDHR